MSYTRHQQIEQLKQLLRQYEVNIVTLELRAANYGLDVPLALVNELREQRANLDAVKERLFEALNLEADSKASAASAVPYLGLSTFQEADADKFFGRDALISNLVVCAGTASLVAVLGPSGSGKSSVVLAGLIPALKRGALPDSADWYYLPPLKLDARPLDALAVTLANARGADVVQMRTSLVHEPETLLLYANAIAGPGRRLVLVIDQAEELWTRAPSAPEQQRAHRESQQLPLIAQLLTAIAAPDNRLLVIITMRVDFLHRAAEHAALASAIAEHDVIISPLTEAELRAVIEEPVSEIGGFEPGLANHLVREAADKPGALPLLSFALSELWARCNAQQTMTWAAFHAIGGVEGALAQKAETVLRQSYTPAQQAIVRQVLLRLVQPGASTFDTRRRTPLADLALKGGQAALQLLLQPLVNSRLLTTGRDNLSNEETIEITHEALIRAWPTLHEWLQASRDDLRFQLKLDDAAAEWQQHSHSLDLLWPPIRLAQANDWLRRAQPLLTTQTRTFLQASRAKMKATQEAQEAARQHELEQAQVLAAEQQRRATEQARFARNLRRLVVALVIVLVLAVGVAVYALQQRNIALNLARIALARQLAGQSQAALDEQPELAFLLSLEAYRTDNNNDTRSSLLIALEHTPQITAYLHGHTSRVTKVAIAPNERILASASTDKTIILWDIATQHMIGTPLQGHDGGVKSIAFSPDSTMLVSGGDDRTILIWDIATHHVVGRLSGHKRGVTSLAFSPNGTTLASGDWDGNILFWNVATDQLLGRIRTYRGSVDTLSFSPDGTTLASGGCRNSETQVGTCPQGEIQLWDVATQKPNGAPLVGHTNRVSSVVFSPDGRTLASGSWDLSIRIWDIASRQQIGASLLGHTGWVYDVAFSPDGKTLASGSWDHTIRFWDTTTLQALGPPLQGHSDGVTSVVFGSDGHTLASGSEDGTLILWDTTARQRLGVALPPSPSRIESLSFSPDGQTLAVGGGNGEIVLWNMATHQPQGEPLVGHTDSVNGLAFNSDGSRLASGSADGQVLLWDLPSGRPTLLKGHTRPIWSVAFSPNNALLASSSADGTIILWDLVQNQHTLLTGHTDRVWNVVFSPDGQTLASASDDKTVRLWDVPTKKLRGLPLTGHTSSVYDVAFSPNGGTLASASRDNTIIIWDSVGHSINILKGYNNSVYDIAFSPDGQMLASGSCSQGDTNIRCTEGDVRIWDVTTYRLLGVPWLSHRDRIFNLAFSPDSHTLASGDLDKQVILWDLAVDSWQRRVCAIVGRNLSREEWNLYLGETPWHATCPQK